MSTQIDFSPWTMATGNLDWGAQNAIHTALSLAAEGKSSIVYGADYSSDGGACLVNTVGQMLAVGGGHGVPSHNFGALVSEFDRLNRVLRDRGVNPDGNRMSPNAAEILLRNFGPLKPMPEPKEPLVHNSDLPGHREIIPETPDEELAAEWLKAISTDAVPEDEIREVVDPVKEEAYAYETYELSYKDLD